MTWCVDAASENFVKLQSKGQQFHPPPAYILALQTIHFITSCLMWKGLFGWKILDFEILPCLPPTNPPPLKTIQVTSLAQAPHFSTKMLKVQLPQAVTMKLGGPSGVHASPQKIPPPRKCSSYTLCHSNTYSATVSSHMHIYPNAIVQIKTPKVSHAGPDFKWVLPLGTGWTAAPGAPHPLRWGSKRYSLTVVGNLGLIALLKILWNFSQRDKKVKGPLFFLSISAKRGAYFYL